MTKYRKFRKLVQRPGDFFRDSKNPLLRTIGASFDHESVKATKPVTTKQHESLKVAKAVMTKSGGAMPKAAAEAKRIADKNRADSRERRRLYSWDHAQPAQNPYVAHYFASHKADVDRVYGVASLPWKMNSERAFVPDLIRHKTIIAPFLEPNLAPDVDVFVSWGVTDSLAHNLARSMAETYQKPLVLLEYGFVSSFGLAVNGSSQHSIIANVGGMYYDATSVSHIERRLNADDYALDDQERRRARRYIDKILASKITKYNHAPASDLDGRIPRDGKVNILLVDQRFGDKSIAQGLSGEDRFEEMIRRAGAISNARVIVKVHPDAISGGKESYLARMKPLLDGLPNEVVYIADDVNPYDLMKNIDDVYVATSQLGFEALMAGKNVTCFGVPWYAGWGLTANTIEPLRPRRARTLEELFHIAYIESSTYFVPGFGICELDVLVDHLFSMGLHAERYRWRETDEGIHRTSVMQGASERLAKLVQQDPRARILIVLASNKASATGRYVQDLAASLMRHGYEIVILADGEPNGIHAGVKWLKLQFEGVRLSRCIRQEIVRFNPDIVYENGVRSRPQRAALEALMLTDARLAMQSEDDDLQVHQVRTPEGDLDHLASLDRPRITLDQMATFLNTNDWNRSISIATDPDSDRWIEPVSRIMCARLAQLHTAIWHPYETRLKKEYAKPTLVVPPGIPIRSFMPETLKAEEREALCGDFGISPNALILFIGGTVYDYSEEYLIFLQSLRLLVGRLDQPLALMVIDGRTRLEVKSLAESVLGDSVEYVGLTRPSDETYMRALRLSDIVCSPGVEDRFTKYRLPSRLVKSMAMGKPVLTSAFGFGEALIHGYNAILTTGVNPEVWAREIGAHVSDEALAAIGRNAREFAEQHFDIDKIADRLHVSFTHLLRQPPALA